MVPPTTRRSPFRFRKAALGTAVSVLIGSWAVWIFSHPPVSDVPGFYASVFRVLPDGKTTQGAYRFSAGDFRNSEYPVLDLASKKIPGLPEDFFAQGLCSGSGGTYVAGGRVGKSSGAARIYRLEGNTSALVAESSEYRFRNCAFGDVEGPVFWGVTHGSGSFFVQSLDTGEWHAFPVPFSYSGSRVAEYSLLHFLAFSDLDDDGADEAYMTVTAPFVNEDGSFGNFRERGTVVRFSFSGGIESGKKEDVGLPQPASARRLKATEFYGKKELFVLYEHAPEPGSAPDARLYRFYGNGGMRRERIFDFPGHRECKTLTEFPILPYPTVQVGCDKATIYVLKAGEGGRLALDRKFVFAPPEITGRSETPRGNYAIHAVLGGDWNSDGKPDVAVSVNGDGIYLADFRLADPVVGKIAFPKSGSGTSESYMVIDMAAAP